MTRLIERVPFRAWLTVVVVAIFVLAGVVIHLGSESAKNDAGDVRQGAAISRANADRVALKTEVARLRSGFGTANKRLRSHDLPVVPTPKPVSTEPPPSIFTPPLPGLPGAAGRPGLRGARGVAGPPGSNGTDGTAGVQGAAGDTGPAGAPGPPGPPGTAGVDGKDGQAGKDGRDAFPFTFTFTVPGVAGDTTYTCTVTGSDQGTCTQG